MKKYPLKFILPIAIIILFSIVYLQVKNAQNCWVCEGIGKNDCIVCINGKNEQKDCVFCEGAGESPCTLCNGTGKME